MSYFKNIPQLTMVHPLYNFSAQLETSLPVCPSSLCSHRLRKSSSASTLVIFTTCNHIEYTIRGLSYFIDAIATYQEADILVVDDASIDGTAPYLIKKGFAVITKPTPRGLTDSWNIGYRIAQLLKYKYIIFANNDVLVPIGAMHEVNSYTTPH